MEQEKVVISGMKCSGCVDKVQNSFQKLAGVSDVKVSLADKQAVFNGHASLAELNTALAGTHYHAEKIVD
ncbi:MAG: cation transporter [Liquorilactobacillus nagelii]|uniref:cation transporter n=1 Tax=Liquorilactobacillus TaxID=2767888 RepID=UPI0039EC63C3